MLPLGTDRPTARPTLVTYILIVVNCAALFAQELALISERDNGEPSGGYLMRVFDAMVLTPADGFHWWQLFTYQFLHAGWGHLLGNAVFLFVFGPSVEDRFRRLPFLAFYLAGGAAAGALQLLFDPARVVGASGSIAAVGGAFLVLFPLTHVRVLFFIGVIGVYAMPAWWFIGFAIAKDMFFHGFAGPNGVAHVAHLGGYGFGAAVPLLLLWAKLIPREPFDLFSIGRQAHRRRQFRELTSRSGTPWRGELSGRERVVRKADQPGKKAALSPEAEAALARRRSIITRLASENRLDEAGEHYLKLLDEHHDEVMGRATQLAIANHLAAVGRHQAACVAYDLFLQKFPRDAELPQVKLLLALIHARYLNDPVRAKSLLAELENTRLDEQARTLAETLRNELG